MKKFPKTRERKFIESKIYMDYYKKLNNVTGGGIAVHFVGTIVNELFTNVNHSFSCVQSGRYFELYGSDTVSTLTKIHVLNSKMRKLLTSTIF